AICLDQTCRNVEVDYVTKKGEVKQGLLSIEIMEIEAEKCAMCVIVDVTERERMKKEMARLERLNLVGEMAAGIAHEIRNPMTTIRGFLQISRNFLKKEHVDIMLGELNRANEILTEFLTLAKN